MLPGSRSVTTNPDGGRFPRLISHRGHLAYAWSGCYLLTVTSAAPPCGWSGEMTHARASANCRAADANFSAADAAAVAFKASSAIFTVASVRASIASSRVALLVPFGSGSWRWAPYRLARTVSVDLRPADGPGERRTARGDGFLANPRGPPNIRKMPPGERNGVRGRGCCSLAITDEVS